MIIQLLNFNSYYNRQYKKLPEIYDDMIVHQQGGVNFNPNDGVNTSLVLNLSSTAEPQANYCLALNDDGTIESKWFIVESTRTRLNQYEIVLRRDLLADYYGDVINAPVFIEKATLNRENPLIFNSEDMTFNQIKTKETLLQDGTQCAWIIGYFSKEYAAEAKTIQAPVEEVQDFIPYDTLDDIPFISSIRAGTYKGARTGLLAMNFGYHEQLPLSSKAYFHLRISTDSNYVNTYGGAAAVNDNIKIEVPPSSENLQSITNQVVRSFKNDLVWQEAISGDLGLVSKSHEDSFLATFPIDGTTIRTGNAAQGYEFYRIERSAPKRVSTNLSPASTSTISYTRLKEALEDTGDFTVKADSTSNFSYLVNYNTYTITMKKLPGPKTFEIRFPASSKRTHLEDAPYDMFAIPYGNTLLASGETVTDVVADTGMKCANAIATSLGGLSSNLLFDLQLLPYCPIPSLGKYAGLISTTNLKEGIDYTIITLAGGITSQPESVIFFPQKSDFSFVISNEDLKVEITEPKVEALCDTYRLVSPNYNGQFEFNAAKNGGVSFFSVDCTYKPFTPYIHINPNFGGLYGQDFDDARGLICGGDFSLPTITDQWINYEINNKNYLNSFNRQVENMEINNKYAKEQDKWAAIAGTVQGAVSGATAGSVAGGLGGGVGMGVGAAVGGIVGGVVSGLAGAADIRINEALRNEALDYTIDQFGYSLGNIRALPYSLNRVSSFNINNKIFPILEYYTCSDVEKEALRNKIKYNGMTVMAIGTIANYLQDEPSYIKGKLIRLEGLDNHTINEIANELNKGFYI